MKKANMTKTAAAALAAAMMLTACGSSSTTTTTVAKDSTEASVTEAVTEATTAEAAEATITDTDIIVAMAADVVSMDPPNQNDTTSSVFLNHVFSRLMVVNNEGELVPDLATSYEIENDGLEYVFHLDENACFSDGTPVTAEDVKFSYERAKNTAKTQSDAQSVEEVIVEDEHTVRIKLSYVYAPFIYKTADTGLSIVCKEHIEAIEAAGGNCGDYENILGSGAYTVTEYVPNDHYVLKRNENYWKELPIATSIEVRVIPEASSRAIALEAGEVDIVWSVDAIDCVNIEANPDVTLMSQPSSSVEFFGMNTNNEALSDVRVRQAINMAVNQQELIDVILEGRGTPANSYINAMIPGWTDEVTAYEYDLEAAKELMAEAGYADGFDVSIVVNGDTRTRTATILQAQLAEIGINVDVNTYEWGAMLDLLSSGGADMYVLGWSNSSFDPDTSVYSLFHSANTGAGGNYAYLVDEELDNLIISAQTELDQEKRMDLYKDIQFKLKELSPWVPLYYKNENVGVRADLKGFELHKASSHWLGNAHYEE